MSYALTVAKAEGFEILVASVDSMSEPNDVDTVIAQLRELGAELNESDREVYETDVVARAERVLTAKVSVLQAKKLSVS